MGAKIYEFNRCQCFDLSCFVCYPSTVCYQIVLRDCVQVLHEHIAAGKQFDYVINDLTEFPVEKSVKGFGYDFETTSLITELSLKAVKDDGKLLARVSKFPANVQPHAIICLHLMIKRAYHYCH